MLLYWPLSLPTVSTDTLDMHYRPPFIHHCILFSPYSVGMMTLAAAQQEQDAKVVAHQPIERKVMVSRGFAASGAQQ
jgi:hypothetical protein